MRLSRRAFPVDPSTTSSDSLDSLDSPDSPDPPPQAVSAVSNFELENPKTTGLETNEAS
jgi:hypothetical protein